MKVIITHHPVEFGLSEAVSVGEELGKEAEKVYALWPSNISSLSSRSFYLFSYEGGVAKEKRAEQKPTSAVFLWAV